MIVADNRDSLQAACKVLAQGGITVVSVASSRAEALRQAEEADPDIVLVDIVLGSESGFDLARRLSTAGSIRASGIMISIHGEEDFADLIEASPAMGFLLKWNLSASGINHLLTRREAEQILARASLVDRRAEGRRRGDPSRRTPRLVPPQLTARR